RWVRSCMLNHTLIVTAHRFVIAGVNRLAWAVVSGTTLGRILLTRRCICLANRRVFILIWLSYAQVHRQQITYMLCLVIQNARLFCIAPCWQWPIRFVLLCTAPVAVM